MHAEVWQPRRPWARPHVGVARRRYVYLEPQVGVTARRGLVSTAVAATLADYRSERDTYLT
jgi:hypothetical protein